MVGAVAAALAEAVTEGAGADAAVGADDGAALPEAARPAEVEPPSTRGSVAADSFAARVVEVFPDFEVFVAASSAGDGFLALGLDADAPAFNAAIGAFAAGSFAAGFVAVAFAADVAVDFAVAFSVAFEVAFEVTFEVAFEAAAFTGAAFEAAGAEAADLVADLVVHLVVATAEK